MLRETFSKKVREVRTTKKVTQKQLAEAAGCTVSFVSLVERNGRCPSLDTIESFAKALKVTPLSLLGA